MIICPHFQPYFIMEQHYRRGHCTLFILSFWWSILHNACLAILEEGSLLIFCSLGFWVETGCKAHWNTVIVLVNKQKYFKYHTTYLHHISAATLAVLGNIFTGCLILVTIFCLYWNVKAHYAFQQWHTHKGQSRRYGLKLFPWPNPKWTYDTALSHITHRLPIVVGHNLTYSHGSQSLRACSSRLIFKHG